MSLLDDLLGAADAWQQHKQQLDHEAPLRQYQNMLAGMQGGSLGHASLAESLGRPNGFAMPFVSTAMPISFSQTVSQPFVPPKKVDPPPAPEPLKLIGSRKITLEDE